MKSIFKKSFTLLLCGFLSLSTNVVVTHASSCESIGINGNDYQIHIEESDNIRRVVVSDEFGQSSTAIFNMKLEELIIDGSEISSNEYALDGSLTTWYTRVLSRTRYTLGPNVTNTATALLAGLIAISKIGAFASAVIDTVAGATLWGSTIYVTISECRSGLKISSGTYAGKYKYWTNVLVECNDFVILDQDHSIYYK